jgi:hypothetical protein
MCTLIAVAAMTLFFSILSLSLLNCSGEARAEDAVQRDTVVSLFITVHQSL